MCICQWTRFSLVVFFQWSLCFSFQPKSVIRLYGRLVFVSSWELECKPPVLATGLHGRTKRLSDVWLQTEGFQTLVVANVAGDVVCADHLKVFLQVRTDFSVLGRIALCKGDVAFAFH